MALGLRIRSLTSACAFAALAAATAPLPSAAHLAPHLALRIDESQTVTLAGNVPTFAQPQFDQGALDPATRMDRMVLLLNSSAAQQSALDALVQAQQNPRSPLYRRWLTPAQYGAQFGVSAGDAAQVAAWLAAHGFTIDEIPAGRRLVVFSGTAGQVQDAFHVEMHRYRVKGALHVANSNDPQIPAALARVVAGVVTLNDFRRTSQIASKVAADLPALLRKFRLRARIRARNLSGAAPPSDVLPQFDSGGNHYLFPADFATIYDLIPLYSSALKGAGVSIAIAGRSNIDLSDVAAFRAEAGLAADAPSVILDGPDPGLVSGDQDESTLDVEWSGAVAPAAAIKLVAAASTAATDGVDLAAEYIVNHDTAPVLSLSYGNCEQQMGATELAFYNSLWEQAASEGISALVASDDSGAAGCSAGTAITGTGKAVNGLCSSPYSTCVGGTEFNEGSNSAAYWSAVNSASDGSAFQYIPEEVWNESGSNGGSGLWASGGGASLVYAQPSWQGAAVSPAANGMRAVPDVALSAAAHDGYILYENGSYWIVSGTSAATPSFAGIVALAVQDQGGAAQGCINPELYALVDAQQDPFHPTPAGNNSVPGVVGFTASGTAYNLATGLGSVDAALLVNEWDNESESGSASGSGSGGGSGLDFTFAPSVESGTVVAGGSLVFNLAVSETGAVAHAVALTATAHAGITVGFSPAAVVPGTPVTVAVTAGPGAAAGAQTIVISGADASGSQSLNFALTVMEPPSLALAAASNSLTLAHGGSGTLSFTASTGGGFAGQIAFAVSSLPAGVTAAWSANPSALVAGLSSTPVSLTLKASALAAQGSFNVTVTASGDGLSATEQVTVTIRVRPACRFGLLSTRCNTQPPVHLPIGH
ncbi:MAG: protease pro-enzyme activation domain-containing protein [Terracidiphilus sp.]